MIYDCECNYISMRKHIHTSSKPPDSVIHSIGVCVIYLLLVCMWECGWNCFVNLSVYARHCAWNAVDVCA